MRGINGITNIAKRKAVFIDKIQYVIESELFPAALKGGFFMVLPITPPFNTGEPFLFAIFYRFNLLVFPNTGKNGALFFK